jgi:exodeoxyribonuclease V beta subunit
MSEKLNALTFPLHGSRLIEASAGTGKTWTIAALYVRLVLGHGGTQGFHRPLHPSEILVMTFTRAATRELCDRIRQRLMEAASYFRSGGQEDCDPYLASLLDAYSDTQDRLRAAHLLTQAADAMDDAAIFTIDAWCQRMLREHAFDSGCLFDEELVASEDRLLADAMRDYWRHHVYALEEEGLLALRGCWPDLSSLEAKIRELVPRAAMLEAVEDAPLDKLIREDRARLTAQLAPLKSQWRARALGMRHWLDEQRKAAPKCFSGVKLKPATVDKWFDALLAWAEEPCTIWPDSAFDKAWERLSTEGLRDACNKGFTIDVPADFAALAELRRQLNEVAPLDHLLWRHAAIKVAERVAELKRHTRQFGFADMLVRLKDALEGANGARLRQVILAQFPVALVDEFQDTSPDQYRILDLLYEVTHTPADYGLFLIGDPKQAIYGFRGADIYSYLAARSATEGRHYLLDTNFRSCAALVEGVNHLFLHAEGHGEEGSGHAMGAFGFGKGIDNPLPFHPVAAGKSGERFLCGQGEAAAITLWCHADEATTTQGQYRDCFAARCAEEVVHLLNDERTGLQKEGEFKRLQAADVAILVRDRNEAEAIRGALRKRGVASVYLSDKDSVFHTRQAGDVLRWLHAVSSPLDTRLARAAFATSTTGLPLSELATLASDDLAWEARVEQLKEWRQVWQRQGVLAMLRRMLHTLNLPARLLNETGGERVLTDLLHLAELLQVASQQLDGEQALIRWLAEQIENDSDSSEERILRLESDAGLVKVITIHKSKGLEYPLVFIPFGVTARAAGKDRGFYEATDAEGRKVIRFTYTDEIARRQNEERLREDLRLFYVAMTRARHAVWLGITSLKDKIDQSAFGYLLAGGETVTQAQLPERLRQAYGRCGAIRIEDTASATTITTLSREELQRPLAKVPAYSASFERDWMVGSYTALTRTLAHMPAPMPAPSLPLEEKLFDDDAGSALARPLDVAWHRFPRGARPGQFLHEQLEWMANEGFACIQDPDFDRQLAMRCERAGWGHREEDVIAWMKLAASTRLPSLDAALYEVEKVVPEMEFWLPATGLDTRALDEVCRSLLPGGVICAALSEKQLRGMLRGFMDLVVQHQGRYWVLDYKSNALGSGDRDYHEAALAQAMAAHRYDVQASLYLLALHRLLKARLGERYDASRQLGGAVFYFLRGAANEATHGCYRLLPDAALLDRLDRLLPSGTDVEVSA